MALQGTIDAFPVVDILGLLSASAKTGCLELTGDRGHGSLWLRDGRIVAGGVVDHPTTGAAEVVFELLAFEEASFEFVVGEYGESEPFESSVAEAVEQAEQMLEVWQQVRDVVPDLSMQVTLVTEIAGDEVTLSAADWSLTARCVVRPTVAAILGELGLGEFEGCRQLADLVQRGLLELSEVEQASEPTPGITARPLVPDEVVPPAVGSEREGADPADSVDTMDRDSPFPERFAENPPGSEAFVPDLDTDFIDEDQTTGANGFRDASRGFTAVPDVANGQVGEANRWSAGAEGFPEHFPIDDLVGSGDQVSFDTAPGGTVGYSEVSAFSVETQPGEPASSGESGAHDRFALPESVTGTDESAHTDDVLAQIGRLSPKAAEAIAAALGDGEDG